MKRKIILTTIISMFLAAITVSAQTAKPNFSGVWELDASKSVLPEMMRINSMTMKVVQTERELSIPSTSVRSSSNSNNGGGTGIGSRGGSYGANTYSLDGKETTSDINNEMMTGKATRKATITSDGKLSLTATSNLETQMGSFTTKTNETWELMDEGNTLKITRYTETPRGATNAEMYFTRKSEGIKTVTGTTEAPAQVGNDTTLKKISGGVLNGKATSLPTPAYPAAARAVKASGAVNVQVTIDEQGNVVSSSAVSGHPLLRAAAEEAARNAKFAPVLLSGVPVMVTGVIVYNFVP